MKAKKFMILGFDGAMPEHFNRFLHEGHMPNIARLIKKGTYSRALPAPPVDSPTNWVTIATGAWPGTHGITSFTIHLPGDPLDVGRSTVGLDSTKLCKAEFLWDAAEKAGKKCLVMNYLCSWPPTFKNGMLVGGPSPSGCAPKWNKGVPVNFITESPSSKETQDIFEFQISLKKAEGWENLPKSFSQPLESKIPSNFTSSKLASDVWQSEWEQLHYGKTEEEKSDPIWDPTYHLLIIDSKNEGYDKVYVCREKNIATSIANLRVKEWSDWTYDKVVSGSQRFEVGFKFRLNELSPKGDKIEIFRTIPYKTYGWTYPPNLAQEIVENVGIYAGGFETYMGYRHPIRVEKPKLLDIYFECTSHQLNYFVNVARYLKKQYSWDGLFSLLHLQDEIGHQIGFDGINPSAPGYDPRIEKAHWGIIRKMYEHMDEQVGKMVKECWSEDMLTIVISDHAAVPIRKSISVNGVLQLARLLTIKTDKETGYSKIDWSRTKAYIRPGFPMEYIWVNLKGRDPQGIVDPGQDYDDVIDQTLSLLYGLKDPETGRCPIALALRKEDAKMLGHWGERASDILYFYKPGYTGDPGPVPLPEKMRYTDEEKKMMISSRPGRGNHSGFLPTAKLGGCSNEAIFVISGPGVKKGYLRTEPIWLVDVAPTLAYLLDIPAPAQSEGHVLYDIMY
jgi:predicted AlkP superfamily phosphohydrolase/phosphomutase